MADVDVGTLLQALLGADKQARESSPYSGFEGIADQLSGSIVGAHKDAPGRLSLKDSLLSSLVLGGIGGLAKGGTESYVARQNDLSRNVLAQAMRGNVFEKPPEGMNASIFNTVNTVGRMQAEGRRMQLEDAAIAAAQKRNETIFGKALDNPEAIARNLGVLGEMTGQGGGMTPGIKPGSYDDLAQKYRGNEALIEADLKRQIETPDRNKATEDALRTQLLGQKAIQNFTEISKQYSVLQQAYADPTAVSDLDYTFGVMKILDPESIVRESEQGQIIQSGSIPSALLGQMNKIIQGKAVLKDDLRRSMLDLAQRRYEISKGIAESLSSEFERMATERGANPANVAVIPQASVLNRAPGAPPGAVDTGRTAGGKPVYEVNGQLWVPD